ncbi:MAG: hypothetical protein ACRDWW_05365, partial [Acidimicrobiales bacterium]
MPLAAVMRRPALRARPGAVHALARHRRRRCLAAIAGGLAAAITLAVPGGVAAADTSPFPNPPFPSCQDEQFPATNAPRSAPSVPYEIPFTATLGQPAKTPGGHAPGGYLEIANSPIVTVILGGPLYPDGSGSVYAQACGLLTLPSQKGGITPNPAGSPENGNADQYNNDFIFETRYGDPSSAGGALSVTIGIKGVPGLPVISAYASADGELAAAIEPAPAANGGLNVDFYSTAKSTSNLGPALEALLPLLGSGAPAALPAPEATLAPPSTTLPSTTLPAPTLPSTTLPAPTTTTTLPQVVGGTNCTIALGDLRAAGLPSADLGSVGLSFAQATTPAHLTSGTSGSLTGQPVTGPITASLATLVSNDFPVGAISPDMPPSPSFPNPSHMSPSQLCSPSNAQLLNELLGLPSPPGKNIFYAPGTFAV